MKTPRRGIQAVRVWSPEELQFLFKHYASMSASAIAEHLNMSDRQVYQKARFLGYSKSEQYMKTNKPGAHALLSAGERFRFQKGIVPWNKGTKGLAGQHENCKKTQFKKGARPVNEMPIGSCRINGDAFLELKFSDEPGPYWKRWVPVHRKVWIEAHGPIPKTHKVAFKPGMKTTVLEEITLDRLELVTHAELMARNTLHQYPPDLVETIRARAQLTRAINKREKEQP